MGEIEYLIRRLQKHTTIDPVTNCWLWTGNLSGGYGNKSAGYGRIGIGGIVYLTHRVSAHIYHGIPLDKTLSKEYQVLHICDNKACWNPDHIYIGNQIDNVEDRDGFCIKREMKCIRGHDLSNPDNYYVSGNDQRKCKQCVKDKYNVLHGKV